MDRSFAAPPARQAPHCLAGNRGPDQQQTFDLALTAFFRRHAATIQTVTIAGAFAVLIVFVLPFLLGR